MSVCLVVIDDGREDYLERCLASAAEHLPAMDACVMVDDSDHELGFDGAIRAGWEGALETDCDWIFHLESDFLFDRPVPIEEMTAVMRLYPRLVQMALVRQAWNGREAAAGGLIAAGRSAYEPRFFGAAHWLEHRLFVTTNPALWPRSVVERGWPEGEGSEGRFGIDLFAADQSNRAAYWGRGEEWVEHIGRSRAGTGY